MAKEIFEEAQEVFIDDRYEEAYGVRMNSLFNNLFDRFSLIIVVFKSVNC